MSAEFRGKGSFALAPKTRWLPIAHIDLASRKSHRISVSLGEPALLLARVNWLGSPGPIRLVIVRDGTTIATGKTQSLPPDRGTGTVRAEIKTPGSATVVVTNDGATSAKAQIVVGTLAVSSRR